MSLNNDWEKEWVGMPEYNNIKEPKPKITATFKFRNNEDFEVFKKCIQENLYNGEKVFDGMQKKTVKSSWYPHKKRQRNTTTNEPTISCLYCK